MGIEKKYTLRLYDEPVADFTVREGWWELEINEDEIRHHNFKAMPEKADNDLLEWVKRRTAPQYREYARELFESAGIKAYDFLEVLGKSFALSATDAYWVTPEGFDGKFADYNFYENDFSDELASVTFSGKVIDCSPLEKPSPEFSLYSRSPKCWRKTDGDLWLYKTASSKNEHSSIEIANEYYASKLAETMDIEHVSYEPVMYMDKPAVRCRNYTDIDHSSVGIWKVINKNVLVSVYEFMEKHGFLSSFADKVLLDAVLLVDDRNYGGIEIIKNNHTLEYERLAPAFNHGCCLYSSVPEEKLHETRNEWNHYRSYYGDRSHNNMVALFCSKRHLKKLEKLYYYRIENEPLFGISEKRLRFMEQLIQKRARELTEVIMNHAHYKDMFPEDRKSLRETFTGSYKGYTYYYDGDPLHGGRAIISGGEEKYSFPVTVLDQESFDPQKFIKRYIDKNLSHPYR